MSTLHTQPNIASGGQTAISSHSSTLDAFASNNVPLIVGVAIAVILSAILTGGVVWLRSVRQKRRSSMDLAGDYQVYLVDKDLEQSFGLKALRFR